MPQKVALVLLRVAAVVVTLFGWVCAADSVDDLVRRPLRASDYVLCFVTVPVTVLGLTGLTVLVFWQARRLGQRFTWPQFGLLTLTWAASVAAWFWVVLSLTFADQLLVERVSLYRTAADVMPLTGEKLILACVWPVAGAACGLAIAAIWSMLSQRPEQPASWTELMPRFVRTTLLGGACGAWLQPALLHVAGGTYGYGKLPPTSLAGYTAALVAAAFALSWIAWQGASDPAGRLAWRGVGGVAASILLGVGLGLMGNVALFGMAFLQNAQGTLDRLTQQYQVLILFLPFILGAQAVIGAACLAGGGWIYQACLRAGSPAPEHVPTTVN